MWGIPVPVSKPSVFLYCRVVPVRNFLTLLQ